MRNGLFLALLLVVTISTVTGCGRISDNSMVGADKKIIMRIGHTQPISHPRHQSLIKFKEIVETKTNNAIEVQIFPAGQLGSDGDQLEMVKTGKLQATRNSQLEETAPELLIYTMPFLFDNLESAHKVTRGPIGEKIARFAEKNNFAILATGDVGDLRDMTNNIRPISRPEDMVGLRMRAPAIATTVKTLEAFGADTVTMPWEEVYLALKAGYADGQENPLTNITAVKLEEVQKYLTIIKYQYLPDPFIVNLAWYNSLEPATRSIIKEAAVEMMRYSDDIVKRETSNSLKKLQKGMVINTLTKEQRAKFIERARPVYDYYIGTGLFTAEDLDEIRKAAAN